MFSCQLKEVPLVFLNKDSLVVRNSLSFCLSENSIAPSILNDNCWVACSQKFFLLALQIYCATPSWPAKFLLKKYSDSLIEGGSLHKANCFSPAAFKILSFL